MTEGTHTASPATRVALLMPNFEAGGAERVMIRLARGLLEQGLAVDLLVLSEAGPYRQEVAPGIRVISLDATRAWLGIPALTHYLRNERPTALLSALFHTNFLAVLARLLARAPTRVVISEHNTLALVRAAVGRWRWLAFRLSLRWAYPRADAVVCVSEGIAQGLRHALPALQPKLHVIGNPVITDEVLQLSQRAVNHPWLAPGQPPLVLAAGRLIHAKGFDVLLRAFAEVVTRTSARLLILGQGPEHEALNRQIERLGLSGVASLHGFTDNPYAWMSRARVFVLSSRHEGLPGALIEAMACGCRVVATDCPFGPGEILEQGQWGRLVPVDDARALAEAIVQVLLARVAPDPRARAQTYRLDKATQAYLKVLRLAAPVQPRP